jgi:hypothetical protein
VEELRLLPHARLAVLPGTDHTTLMCRSEWLVPMRFPMRDRSTEIAERIAGDPMRGWIFRD